MSILISRLPQPPKKFHFQHHHSFPQMIITVLPPDASHCRTNTPYQSEHSVQKPQKHHYYKPQENQKSYYMNAKGYLYSHQDPEEQNIKVNNPQKLPIYHEPASVLVNSVEDLLKLYPNCFDMLGSLKGEYDIKIDPNVPPVQHSRRKVSVECKTTLRKQLIIWYNRTSWGHR